MNDGIRTVEDTGMTPPVHHCLAQDAAYKRKCEFAVKAGYRWAQAEAVLQANPDATEDEMLAKLVHLSARASPTPRARCPSGMKPGSEPPVGVDPSYLRPIVIDGSNVAMTHGKGKFFSCHGILLAVQYFRERGHQLITVFVPSWRKEASKPESPITDQDILLHLEKEGQLVFTPSKRIGEKRIVCYDDRFIVKFAATKGGVIVSNDNYRDLVNENDAWRETIEKRVLMFTFAQDLFMVPDDPYGRNGPTLEQLLRSDTSPPPPKGQAVQKQQGKICPYADKCTFGKKCRFYHPEREESSSSSKVSSASSTSVPDQKASQGSSRNSSTEDLSSTVLEQYSGVVLSRKFDISEIEEQLSTLNLAPELCVHESEQGVATQYFSSGSSDRKLVHSMPSQIFEPSPPACRCVSIAQSSDTSVTMAAKRTTYPFAQPPGNQSKQPNPVHQVGAVGSAAEHSMHGNLVPSAPLRIHRDMNGQLLSRGVGNETGVHLPITPSQLSHRPHSPSYHPAQYMISDSQPQNPAHFRDQGMYYLQAPQQSAGYGQRQYNPSYYGNCPDPSADQSCYPLCVDRDYQSVNQPILYGNLLRRLGPEYRNKILLFLHHYPDVQNVDIIVDYILHKL